MAPAEIQRQMIRLSTSVINHLRSSTILSDVAQIAEELVCNSIDAGATQIQIAIDGEAYHMRVDDDGCGISREDLSLVGQRHATSKLHCVDELEGGVVTLGFRGEALSSLCDIAVVEITSRCRGMPNTYRKILKGCTTVSIGICGEQRTHGTTVIVRDMFYNQPVRRRRLNSSHKKTMQSVKERIMRFVLIHSHVSFTVTDLARKDVLLVTKSALTLSHRLLDMFGDNLFTKLREIDYAQGYLRLTGFLSNTYHCHPSKDLQYFYINRRYVLKTALHKLLNSWVGPNNFNHAGKCKESLEKINCEADMSGNVGTLTGQHLHPMFVLNMTCPLSDYDITFEATKTLVEFKDSMPVVSFIRSVLQMIWGNESSCKNKVTGFPQCPEGASNVLNKKNSNNDNVYQYGNYKRVVCRKEDIPPMAVRRALVQCGSSNHYSSDEDLIVQENINTSLYDTPSQPGSGSKILSPSHMFVSSQTARAPCVDTVLKAKQVRNTSNKFQTECDTPLLGRAGDVTPCWQERTLYEPGVQLELMKDEASPTNPMLNWFSNVDDHLLPLSKEHVPPRTFTSSSSSSFVKGNRTFMFKNDQYVDSTFFHSPLQIDKYGSPEGTLMKQSINSGPCDVKSRRLAPLEDMDTKPCKEWLEPDDFQVGIPLWFGSDDSFDSTRIPDASDLSPNSVSSSLLEGSSKEYTNRKWSLPEIDRDRSDIEITWTPMAETKRQRLRYRAEADSNGINDFSSPKSCFFSPDPVNYSESVSIEKPNCNSWKLNAGDATEEIASGVSSFKCFRKFVSNEIHDDMHLVTDRLDVIKHDDYDPEVNSNEPLAKKRLDLIFNNGSGLLQCYTDRDGEESPSTRDKFEHDSRFHVSQPRKICSGPPFYRPPKRYGIHLNPLNSLSTVERMVNNLEDAVPQATEVDGEISKTAVATMEITTDLADSGQDCSDHLAIQTTSCVDKLCKSKQADKTSNAMVEDELPLDRVKSTKTLLQISPLQRSKYRSTIANKTDSEKAQLPMSSVKEMFKEWSNPCLKKYEDVLDLSSGILASSSSSVLPGTITKDILKHARVLRQVDTKFIAAVACDILLLVDQHAADERVRLEELREDVLGGNDMKKSFLLSSSQELTITLIELQMLQTYQRQIEDWGWRWKLESGNRSLISSSMGGMCKVLLSSVPCIMGVNLTAGDLTEYLHQLIDTEGSSAPPPAVIKVLNNKACRGAIMFGDTLLPAECNQLIEHLKKTLLCFQCAHGRPTMIPLVDLRALQERLDQTSRNSRKLPNMGTDAGQGLIGPKAYKSSHDEWHGLDTDVRPTIERAEARLRQAMMRI